MRFAYADPPYLGRNTSRLYDGHPDNAGPVDHARLVERLCDEYPDGWALSGGNRYLKQLLSLCPDDVRVLAWCKPGPLVLKNIYPTHAWEPVVIRGGRRPGPDSWTPVFDYLVANAPGGWYLKGWSYPGAKPPAFCNWLFRCLGAGPGDCLDDLFPGSGTVRRTWDAYLAQGVLIR
jgi:hypothetical protein